MYLLPSLQTHSTYRVNSCNGYSDLIKHNHFQVSNRDQITLRLTSSPQILTALNSSLASWIRDRQIAKDWKLQCAPGTRTYDPNRQYFTCWGFINALAAPY